MRKFDKIFIAATSLASFGAFMLLYANGPELGNDMADTILVGLASLAMVVFFSVEFRNELPIRIILTVVLSVAVFNVAIWSWILEQIAFNSLGFCIAFFMAEFALLTVLFEKMALERKH
ncbi:MAG TPA: hypothetical protein VM265_03175 [Sphingomicrobium sp.]|nr:hypothetical protein [Sphingomicrobium sp.]